MKCHFEGQGLKVIFLKMVISEWKRKFVKVAESFEKVVKVCRSFKFVKKDYLEEISFNWKEVLPISLLWTRVAPKAQLIFSPFEAL